MSKRNVAFTKPEEPNFLKRIKQEIGYKEPDTIEAKRATLENFSDDDDEDYQEREDEKPTVVQLKTGDLTEEEAARLAKEAAEKPADLTQRIVFKGKKKEKTDSALDIKTAEKSTTGPQNIDKSKRKKGKPTKNLLSFEEEDDEG